MSASVSLILQLFPTIVVCLVSYNNWKIDQGKYRVLKLANLSCCLVCINTLVGPYLFASAVLLEPSFPEGGLPPIPEDMLPALCVGVAALAILVYTGLAWYTLFNLAARRISSLRRIPLLLAIMPVATVVWFFAWYRGPTAAKFLSYRGGLYVQVLGATSVLWLGGLLAIYLFYRGNRTKAMFLHATKLAMLEWLQGKGPLHGEGVSPTLVAHAARELGALGSDAGSAVPELTKHLADKSAQIRRAVVQALGQIGVAAVSALPLIIGLTEDPDAQVRCAAVNALERIRGAEGKDTEAEPVEYYGDSQGEE